MLTPKVKAKEFAKYGFKRCKDIPRGECYYLCVARGCKMIFVSDICFDIIDWEEDDPRIHKRANCREHCAWLKTEKDIENHAIDCLLSKAYEHWKDFPKQMPEPDKWIFYFEGIKMLSGSL